MATLQAVQYQRLPSPLPVPSLTRGNSAGSSHISANAGLHDHDQDHDCDDVDNVFRIDDIDTDDGPSIDDMPDSARRFASSSSFYLSQSSAHENGGDEQDFIHLVTEISRVYKRGTYLKMMNMDTNEWKKLDQGLTFSVSSSSFTFPTQTVSSEDHRIVDQVSNKLAIKHIALSGLMESTQIRSFVLELRVLDHLFTNPFIVGLRGVGWFNEFDNGVPSPKPAIILEEAFGTLDLLVDQDKLDFKTLFSIYGQVASGLSAVHQIHAAHGDVKPANVLLFKIPHVREGVEGYTYIAKLSDFGSTIFDSGRDQAFPPGTRGYTAPEVDAAHYSNVVSSFENILKTDVWSLGILFAVLWCNKTESLLGSHGALDPRVRTDTIRSEISIRLGNSSAEPELIRVAKVIFDNTLQIRPRLRRLSVVKDNLDPYLPRSLRTSDRVPEILSFPNQNNLKISYDNLKHLSGTIKDKITTHLLKITESQDPRRPQALWELGVIYLSRFSDPEASIQDGLSFILRSARAGDPRAKALHRRLWKAYAPEDKGLEVIGDDSTTWLEEAAIAGHQTALVELAARGEGYLRRVTVCQAANALHRFDPVPSCPIKHWDTSAWVSTKQDTALHRAAATGNADHLKFLVQELDIDLDARNLEGDTPLISACQFGQLETALILLRRGASALARNKIGENALHFCWCFFGRASEVIVNELLTRGAEIEAIAMGHPLFVDLDILPILPGTPAERAAGRRRFDLVLMLLEHKNILRPSNGCVARRVLVWALRLHDIPLQQLILQHEMLDPSSVDQLLSPMWKTTWLYKGEERNLLDAACAGWVRGSTCGWDVPFDFWLACCNGSEHAVVLRRSLAGIVDMLNDQQPYTEKTIDKSIMWAFGESLYRPFTDLLRLKVEKTDGHGSLLQNVNLLRWEMRGNNPCPMSVLIPINSTFKLTFSRPAQTAHLIDRIFHSEERGTLLQQAMRNGDRAMFRLLLQWRANARLPAPIKRGNGLRFRHVESILGGNVNAYALLAYTEHKDLWFADKLQKLRIPLSCPWNDPPFSTRQQTIWGIRFKNPDWGDRKINVPPLLDAVGLHFWGYALWLLKAGVSLEEHVNPSHTMVDVIAGMHCQECIEFFFEGGGTGKKAGKFLPRQYRESNSCLLYDIFFGMFDRSLAIAHTLRGAKQASQPVDCLQYLLNEYPLPAESSSPVLARVTSQRHSRRWLVNETARISNRQGDALRLLFKVWGQRGENFPRQNLLSYLCNSAADNFHPDILRSIMEENQMIDLGHLSPSATHPALLGMWGYGILASGSVVAVRVFFSFSCIFFSSASDSSVMRWILAFIAAIFYSFIAGYILYLGPIEDWLNLVACLRGARLPCAFLTLQAAVAGILFGMVLLQAILLPVAAFGFFAFGSNPTLNPLSVTSKSGSTWELCGVPSRFGWWEFRGFWD